MKDQATILLATAVALAVVGVLLERQRTAAAAQQATVSLDPMSWITEWGKNA